MTASESKQAQGAASSDERLRAVEARVASRLADLLGESVDVSQARPLFGGACQDNVRLDVRIGGAEPQRLVLRSDAPSSLQGSLGRRVEFDVIRTAVAAGVPTPRARWLDEGFLRDGAWAYFLDWIPGVAIGRRVVGDSRLSDARAVLAEQLAEALAQIHAIEPTETPSLDLPRPSGPPASTALQRLTRSLDRLERPRPALTYVQRWLVENEPGDDEVVLVHGDYRTGNFMVGPEGLTGILDWEFAHWGSPYEDLAWISVRDWRFSRLDRPIGGFSDRSTFYRAYERATGRPISRETLHWWEVYGNARWATGCLQQGERYLSGAVEDLELIAIAPRTCEMEWEALRLIDRGPSGQPKR